MIEIDGRDEKGWLALVEGQFSASCGGCGVAFPLNTTGRPHARKRLKKEGWVFGPDARGVFRWRCPDCKPAETPAAEERVIASGEFKVIAEGGTFAR